MMGRTRAGEMSLPAMFPLLILAHAGTSIAFTHSISAISSRHLRNRPPLSTITANTARFAPGGEAKVSVQKLKEAALIKWLEDNDVNLSKNSGWGTAPHAMGVASTTQADFEDSGRGLLARKPINEGEELVSIPVDCTMRKESAIEVLGSQVITPDMGEYIAIALLLMHERLQGESSVWKPYIDILPEVDEVNPLFSWSEDDLDAISGSPSIPAVISMKNKVLTEYGTLLLSTFHKFPDRFPTEQYTFALFTWAMAMLFSRAINVQKLNCVAMVPYADLINHSPFANTFFDASGGTGFFDPPQTIALFSDRQYARMDQVYVNYGQKSNADLLLLYGFVLNNNPFDSLDLTVGLNPDDPHYQQKLAFCASTGQPTQISFPLSNDRYPIELREYLRLVVWNPMDGALETADFSDSLTDRNEFAALFAIKNACELALAAYKQSEEQDGKMINDRKLYSLLSEKVKLGLRLVRGEKRILRRTINVVKTEIDALDTTQI